MAKRAPLAGGVAGLASVKPGAATDAPEDVAPSRARAGRPKSLPDTVRSYTLRLPAEVLRQLNQLALDQDTTARALLLHGLNLVFKENRLPPIAE